GAGCPGPAGALADGSDDLVAVERRVGGEYVEDGGADVAAAYLRPVRSEPAARAAEHAPHPRRRAGPPGRHAPVVVAAGAAMSRAGMSRAALSRATATGSVGSGAATGSWPPASA